MRLSSSIRLSPTSFTRTIFHTAGTDALLIVCQLAYEIVIGDCIAVIVETIADFAAPGGVFQAND